MTVQWVTFHLKVVGDEAAVSILLREPSRKGEIRKKRRGGGQLLTRVITVKFFSLSWPGKSFSLKREEERSGCLSPLSLFLCVCVCVCVRDGEMWRWRESSRGSSGLS